MRRLRLTIPVLVAILLTGMLLLPATTQGAPIPYYESIGVAADVHESGDVFFDEARNGVLLGHQPIVAKAQGSGDKPIYAELIERVAAFAKQLLDKVPTGITSAFTGPDWMRNVALVLISFAVLSAIHLKLKERAWPKIDYPTLNAPVTQPPSDLPAAAVSVLESRKVSLETFLAALIEMCQKDVLQVVGIRVMPGRTTEGKNYASEYEHIYQGKYIYWLVSKSAPQFEWERIVLNSIPKQPMMIDALIDRLHYALVGPREALIGKQLGEHLRYRGLFNDNPVQAMSDADRGSLAHVLGAISVCIGFGLLSYWLLSSWVSWPQWANLASSVVGGIIFGVIYAVVVEPSRIGHITPTRAGIQEISRWLALKESLPQFDPSLDADHLDSLLPYAIAFDEVERWLQDNNPAPSWFDAMNLRTYASGANYDKMPPKPLVPFAFQRSNDAQNLIPDNDEAYHAFMSAKGWVLFGRSSRAAEAAVREQDNPKYSPPSSSGGGDGGNGDGGDGGGGDGGGG